MGRCGGGLLTICLLLTLLSGCAHRLTVTNIDAYETKRLPPLHVERKNLALQAIGKRSEVQILIEEGIAGRLRKHANKVELYKGAPPQDADILVDISLHATNESSPWNFLIAWPGFILLTPTWHGYVYHINYTFKVELRDPATQAVLDSFAIPVYLNIRHSDFGRTWIQGVGCVDPVITPAVAGIYFAANFDDGITDETAEEIKFTLGDYIAREIAGRIEKFPRQKRNKALEKSSASAEAAGLQIRPMSHHYDSATRTGTLIVDIGKHGDANYADAYKWALNNIGVICSSKQIGIVSGQPIPEGATFVILSEKTNAENQLEITFKVVQ